MEYRKDILIKFINDYTSFRSEYNALAAWVGEINNLAVAAKSSADNSFKLGWVNDTSIQLGVYNTSIIFQTNKTIFYINNNKEYNIIP